MKKKKSIFNRWGEIFSQSDKLRKVSEKNSTTTKKKPDFFH